MADFSDRELPDTIVLFDVDGTLTVPRKVIEAPTAEFMKQLRKKCIIGLVGGSDLVKIEEQMAENARPSFDFVFAENGLTAYRGSEQLASQTFLDFMGEEKLQKFINFTLKYIADLDIPMKRGTFIEFRSGMLNVSPIGRNCSREERNAFNAYDEVHKVREKMVAALYKQFPDYGLKMSIGGQISFDVFPIGWDKTYCLRHVKEQLPHVKTIHFFGDKTYEGGNDYEIFTSDQTIGHTVTSPEDTIKQLKEIFGM